MSEREDIFRDIQTVLTGHSELAIIQALLTCLVTAIGVSAKNIQHAEGVINALPAELNPILRDEWTNYRKHRAQSEARRRIEEGHQPH